MTARKKKPTKADRIRALQADLALARSRITEVERENERLVRRITSFGAVRVTPDFQRPDYRRMEFHVDLREFYLSGAPERVLAEWLQECAFRAASAFHKESMTIYPDAVK